jgi:hypothetical protein
MPNLVEITQLHPRAEWLLRGADQHKLVENALNSPNETRPDVTRASTSPRINSELFAVRLGPHLRVVPFDTPNREALTTKFRDDYCE